MLKNLSKNILITLKIILVIICLIFTFVVLYPLELIEILINRIRTIMSDIILGITEGV